MNEQSLVARICGFCGVTFYAHRADAKYCSSRCRMAASRWRRRLPLHVSRLEYHLGEITHYLGYPDARPAAAKILTQTATLLETVLRENNIRRVK